MKQSTQSNYLIVDRRILPDYYGKVVETCELLRSGRVKDVSEAVRVVGISRSTYYKYKDYIFMPSDDSICSKAVLSFLLTHETGILSGLLNALSSFGANVLTIMQSPPISGRANVVITLDIINVSLSAEEMLASLSKLEGVQTARLVDIE